MSDNTKLIFSGRFVLPLTEEFSPPPAPIAPSTKEHPFSTLMIFRNALWFCRLRWGVALIFITVGTLGLTPRPQWAWSIAFMLAVVNVGYLLHLTRLKRSGHLQSARFNLWTQIAVDLFMVSGVVHFLGNLATYSPFLYLLHIVLASIFFSRRQSLGVTVFALCLYLGLLGLEAAGLLAPEYEMTSPHRFINLSTLTGIWLAAWYLTSRVSAVIRERDRELAETNEQLVRTQADKTKHMLRTTHELKAPFAAIHANTQLLLNGYCGTLPAEALAVIRRIAERSQRLSAEIQDMLQLANLTTVDKSSLRWAKLDVADVLKKCTETFGSVAASKKLTLQTHFESAIVTLVEDHLNMLFTNLLSNAVNYSRQGGTVQIGCGLKAQGSRRLAWILIEDQGIGIPQEKLPKIFDEYYRTEEAAEHNKESTGLGLAIVKAIALSHRIALTVESTPQKGTRFTLEIPENPPKTSSQDTVAGLERFQRILRFIFGGH